MPANLTAPAIGWVRAHGVSLAVALIVFWLALKGGSYALTVRTPVAIVAWLTIGLAVAVAAWPRSRLPRATIVTWCLLAAFSGLNALSMAWADSAEKAFAEFDRASLYLAVFGVVVLATRRASAWEWSNGLALGIVAVGLLALSSRLFPELLGQSDVTSLKPNDPRLSYPVNYWIGLAVLIAFGLPLLLAAAVRRAGRTAALAVAPLPALAVAIYLTSSRAGLVTAALAIVAFVAFTSRRLLALAAVVTSAVGSAVAIVALSGKNELVNGPVRSAAAVSQGKEAAIVIVLVCALTALAYALLRRVVPAEVRVTRGVKRGAMALGLVLVAGGLAAADPGTRIERFKQPPASFERPLSRAGDSDAGSQRPSSRFGRSYVKSHFSGGSSSGRWQFWQAAVDQFRSRPLLGRGAGSYEAWWAQHGTLFYFTRNAHSVFFEASGELGATGLLLLLATFGAGLWMAARRLHSSTKDDRPVVAGLSAALLTFMLAAATDWMWDVTVVGAIGIVCLALLTGPATVFAGPGPPAPDVRRSRSRRYVGWRAATAVLALAAVLAQAMPLLTERKVRASQRALRQGDQAAALSDAKAARTLQDWAASPHLQLALVEERRGKLRQARQSIRRAIARDPSDWRLWAVASRIERESGSLTAARRSYGRAFALNPRSPLLRRPEAGRDARPRGG